MDDRSGRDAWVGILVFLLIAGAILALVSGFALGYQYSETQRLTDEGSVETVRDGSTFVAWIVGGLLTAALWGAAAAALVLLRDIARAVERRALHEKPVPPQPSEATPWEPARPPNARS